VDPKAWNGQLHEVNSARPWQPEVKINCLTRADAVENTNFQANRVCIFPTRQLILQLKTEFIQS
jgi:hypothetical protein